MTGTGGEPTDKVLVSTDGLGSAASAGLVRDLDAMGNTLARRLEANPENAENGLVQLVLGIVELMRQLMERQALQRVDSGELSDEQVEMVGLTLMRLDRRMAEMKEHFGLTDEDLNLDLGPLGRLL